MDFNAIKDLFSNNHIDLEIYNNGNEFNINISTNRLVKYIATQRDNNSSVAPGIVVDKSLLNGFDYKSISYDYSSIGKISMNYQKNNNSYNLLVDIAEKERFERSGLFVNVDYETGFLVFYFKQIIDYLEE